MPGRQPASTFSNPTNGDSSSSSSRTTSRAFHLAMPRPPSPSDLPQVPNDLVRHPTREDDDAAARTAAALGGCLLGLVGVGTLPAMCRRRA
jgi:hypothetical protein